MVRYDARWRVEREMQKFVALAENSRAHKFTRDFHSTFPHSFLLVCNVLRLAKEIDLAENLDIQQVDIVPSQEKWLNRKS